MDGSEDVPEDERDAYREWLRIAKPNPELDAQLEALIERQGLRERFNDPEVQQRVRDIIARGRGPQEPLHKTRARHARWKAAAQRAGAWPESDPPTD